jgi:hypothetical protein
MDEWARIVPLDPAGLLIAMMRNLAGNAQITMWEYGDFDFSGINGAREDEPVSRKGCGSLRWGHSDRVVIPLDPATIQRILDQILTEGLLREGMEHIEIERDGKLEFGAYDHFHPRCVGVGPGVPIEVLEELVSQGTIAYPDPEDDEAEQSIPCLGVALAVPVIIGVGILAAVWGVFERLTA